MPIELLNKEEPYKRRFVQGIAEREYSWGTEPEYWGEWFDVSFSAVAVYDPDKPATHMGAEYPAVLRFYTHDGDLTYASVFPLHSTTPEELRIEAEKVYNFYLDTLKKMSDWEDDTRSVQQVWADWQLVQVESGHVI